jgi:glycerol-3-phosphate dehydrogenase
MTRDLKSLAAQEFDVLIVGAGIYGATAAWDAALRGLSVALIDRGDFGGATSANSLKIVHGGLRYLQTLDVERMRESIRERRTFMHIAPHLVHPLHCVMPTYGHGMKGKEVLRMGMLMNDIISFDRNRIDDPQKQIPLSRVISKEECLRLIPGIDGNKVTGGALWTDAQMYSSERLVLAFVLSAVRAGTHAANYVEAVDFLRRDDCITGMKVRDVFTGDTLDIRARIVVNTSGGWVDDVLEKTRGLSRKVGLSTAMNLVVNRQILPECAAGIHTWYEYEKQDGSTHRGRRVLFMTPWNDCTLVGTYHLPYDGHPDALRVTEAEVHAFLEEINRGYPGEPIDRRDVTFFHKGFLPMDGINRKSGEVKLTKHSRIHDHQKEEGIEGLISVVGVKYTTARDVSEKTVSLVFRKLSRHVPTSRSRDTRLVGGEVPRFEDFLSQAERHKPAGSDARVMRHLVHHYGSEYPRILEYGKENRDWIKSLPGSEDVLGAEVVHAVREEMALKLGDVVLRRTNLGSGGIPKEESMKAVSDIMAQELGWSETRRNQELREVEVVYVPAE